MRSTTIETLRAHGLKVTIKRIDGHDDEVIGHAAYVDLPSHHPWFGKHHKVLNYTGAQPLTYSAQTDEDLWRVGVTCWRANTPGDTMHAVRQGRALAAHALIHGLGWTAPPKA